VFFFNGGIVVPTQKLKKKVTFHSINNYYLCTLKYNTILR